MSPQSIEINKEFIRKHIQELENLSSLKKQKIFEYEEKIKSETSLSSRQKSRLKESIKSLNSKISKYTEILTRFKNGKYDLSDIKTTVSIIAGNSKFKSSHELMNQLALNSQDKNMQNVLNACQKQPNEQVSRVYEQSDGYYDPTSSISLLDSDPIVTSNSQTAQLLDGYYDPTSSISLLDSDPIVTSNSQTAQLLNGSPFSSSDFDDLILNSPQPGSSGQESCQQPDGYYDPTSSISLLDSDPIVTSNSQTAQLLNGSPFSSSDFDDLILNSPQPGSSGQESCQQSDGYYDPTSSISLLDSDPIVTSNSQTAQLLNGSPFSSSDFDDLTLNSPRPGSSSSEPRLQSLTQKQSCEKITQSGANLQNLQQEGQKPNDFPQRALTNWVNKQKQQVLSSSHQKPLYSSKTIEVNTAHSHNMESAISTSDVQLQSTNEINLNQKKVPQPESVPTRSTVIVEVPQQSISLELRSKSSTVQQRSATNNSTNNPTFLRNPLDQLGKRKADFDRTEQDQIKGYNQLLELTDKRCRNEEENRQKNKEDIIENKQVQEIQMTHWDKYNPILLSHPQKMKIIELVESINNYNLGRLHDMEHVVDEENDNEIKKQLKRRYRSHKYALRDRIDLLNRFKTGNVTIEGTNHLIRISRAEERRLQDFVNIQQYSNEPGPSRLDTSKPVSELERLKASLQQLNNDEEYLKSKWEESQQKRHDEEFLREEEQSPEEIELEKQKQRISEKEYNEKLQQLHKAKQAIEDILEQKRLELQQLDQLEKDKQETITLTAAKSQTQLQVSPQPGPSRIDTATSCQQDDNEIASFENDEKFDALVETILDDPCESDDVTITSPQPQTINWWTELFQKFKDSFTAIPPNPISAAEIRTKIRQDAKSRQEERVRLKEVAAAKSKLLKQKEKLVQDLEKEYSKLYHESWDNGLKLPKDSYDRYQELRVLLPETKLEINQLQEDVRGLKYYFKKLTHALGAIVDTYVWLRDGFSAPGFGYEVENSFENQRKNALRDLLPSLIDEESGAYSENALDRVKIKFFENTGIDLKDRDNLTEFNRTLEKCRNSRIWSQSWQIFSDRVVHTLENKAAQQKQADSTPSGMAEKNARDEAASRAELDYLAQTLPQRLAEAESIRLQQAHKNKMTWMQQNSYKFSQIEPNRSSSKSQQQRQQCRLQDANNSTVESNSAQASVRTRQVQTAQKEQMTLERAMKLWTPLNPIFESYAQMIASANELDRAVKMVSANPSKFKPTPSPVDRAVSAINRNTTRIITSRSQVTNPNSTAYTAAKPMSPKNASEQKVQHKKSTKTPVLE